MAGCIFCQKQDDVSGMDVYTTCKIGDGKPCPPCVEYMSLEAEIQAMQDSLQKKLVRRREIREKINQRHNRMSIVLPPELTAYIFELAAWVDPLSLPFTPADEDKFYAPLFLGAVCRSWRDEAWSMPQLWTYIHIHIDVPDFKDLLLSARMDIIEEWLSRTGSHLPLSINLVACEDYDPEEIFPEQSRNAIRDRNKEIFAPLADLLGLHSPRWQILSVTAPPEIIGLLCNKYNGGPMLQTLYLSPTISEPTCYFSKQNELFNNGSDEYPQPTFVHLLHLPPFVVGLEWNRVTELILQSMWFDHVVYILPHISNLTKLELSGPITGFRDRSIIPSTVTTCPKIKHLQLRSSSQDSSAAFLASLTLPALKELAIDLHGCPDVLLQLTLLLRRSSSVLTVLGLDSVPKEPVMLLELVECLHHIEDLEICAMFGDSECPFLQALQEAYIKSNSPVLPKLRRIHYLLSGLSRGKDNLLPKFIIDRFVDPTWMALFPEWRSLRIQWRLSWSIFSSLGTSDLDIQTRQRLLALVDSGKGISTPFEVTTSDILQALEDYTTYMGEGLFGWLLNTVRIVSTNDQIYLVSK